MDFLVLSSHNFAGIVSFLRSFGPQVSKLFRSCLNGERTLLTSSVNGIVVGSARISSEVGISLVCFH